MEGRRERGEEGEREKRGGEITRAWVLGYISHLLSVLMNVAAGLMTLPLRVYDS